MRPHLLQVSDDFWNLRGSFKIGGLLDVGTQASLVRRKSGSFLLLDACGLTEVMEQELLELTDGGAKVEAILHLHPFHTIFARELHERFPRAKLHGTARHLAKLPELPWEPLHTEDPELHAAFADDLDFSVPRGVDFISANESVHFSSVLAFHRASKTIHVDDTFNYTRLPKLLRPTGLDDTVSLHPTLAKALEKRAGAAQEFRDWAAELADRWQDAQNLCAAHIAALLGRKNQGDSIHQRLLQASAKVEGKLAAHQRKYG